ncbi:TlpA family protein disulfide reductase [Pedobacter hiemivivus]|uniref:TlpA family protein disulfide reductase n=1 Tax=Pedobacter hiemivivus TaxID=2530454 RepID=A0A4R0NGG6_9SPHI|nr:TlpA disulfide reductase family protein [Pedobacter hiemivivus]TCC99649.1 TlpA family protein disulfide reductase [Pedobacter hiemivivus]
MYKKCYVTALLLSLTVSIFAQLPVQITGNLNKQRISPVKLFKVEGKPEEIASSVPTADGKFAFTFYPETEGLYVLGTGNVNSPSDNYSFYFKGGEQLSLTINDSNYELRGTTNSKENMVMAQWFKLTEPIYQKAINFSRNSSTFIDFFPQLEEIVGQSKTFLKGKATGNAKFDKYIAEIMAWDLANYAANFINTPRSAHPDLTEFSPYYAGLNAQDLTKSATKVFAYPWGFRVSESVMMINMRQKNMTYAAGVDGVKQSLSFISNDTLKGDFALKRMESLKNYTDYITYANAFGQYFLTSKLKKKNVEIAASLATLKPGDSAFNFSYPDNSGKTVSMADLRGKVVLVDVWATWCGPCKKEIPSLKKLEEEMKGMDVQVVSISVDEAKDKEKWLKMIKDENLGGLQLFASGWSDIAQFYKINAIPRFMVFDKAGKIVTIDSPRPSNPELKALLEKTLAN